MIMFRKKILKRKSGLKKRKELIQKDLKIINLYNKYPLKFKMFLNVFKRKLRNGEIAKRRFVIFRKGKTKKSTVLKKKRGVKGTSFKKPFPIVQNWKSRSNLGGVFSYKNRWSKGNQKQTEQKENSSGVFIKNDRRSQEWAKWVRSYLKKRGIKGRDKKGSLRTLLEPKYLKVRDIRERRRNFLPLAYEGVLVQYYSPVRIVSCISDQLINAGLHLGSNYKRFCPEASHFLMGKRHSLFLINLVSSLFFLRRGLAYVGKAASLKIPVLFVLSKKEGRDYLSSSFKKLGHFATVGRYIPGTISNYRNVKAFSELPGVVCIGDTKNCGLAVNECRKLDIPFFGFCDSDMDPSWFFFPVYGNNDSLEGSRLLYFLLRETILLQSIKEKKEFGHLDLIWNSILKKRSSSARGVA